MAGQFVIWNVVKTKREGKTITLANEDVREVRIPVFDPKASRVLQIEREIQKESR
jgi:hypothetical protein